MRKSNCDFQINANMCDLAKKGDRTKNGDLATVRTKSTCMALAMLGTVAFMTSFQAKAADYDGPKITFEQIYANPDDQDLNLNYARQQAATGDLLSAASTLERLLFASPNWDSARLFYATVLYKLDDRKAALRELALLDGRPLSPTQRALVDAYKNSFNGKSANQQATGKLRGSLALGIRYDNNAGNALTDSIFIFASQEDIAAFAEASLHYSTPIGTGKLKFNAGANGQMRRQNDFSNADYDAFGVNAGFAGSFSDTLLWNADFLAAQVNISGDKYLSQIGGRLTIKKALNNQTGLWLRGTLYDQSYDELPFTVGESLRGGNKSSVTAGIVQRFDAKSYFGASIAFEDKKATNPAYAYDGIRFRIRVLNEFENNVYATARATYRSIKYDGASFNNPGPTRREDDHVSGYIGLGTSITTLGTWMGMTPNPSLDNFSLETGVNYTNRESNNPNLGYENFGVQGKLIWDF